MLTIGRKKCSSNITTYHFFVMFCLIDCFAQQAFANNNCALTGNLVNAVLQGCNFQNQNLNGLNLQGANLQGSNLQNANLENADLQGANLQGANLQNANLAGANLENADLQGANLQQADMNNTCAQSVNFIGANLQQVVANSANLSLADFKGANVQKLSGTNIILTDISATGNVLTSGDPDWAGANTSQWGSVTLGNNSSCIGGNGNTGPSITSIEISSNNGFLNLYWPLAAGPYAGQKIIEIICYSGSAAVSCPQTTYTLTGFQNSTCSLLASDSLIAGGGISITSTNVSYSDLLSNDLLNTIALFPGLINPTGNLSYVEGYVTIGSQTLHTQCQLLP